MYIKKEYDTRENKVKEIEIKIVIDYGTSVTDKSKFRPNVSSLNEIAGATSTGLNRENFEFQDGIDNGMRFYTIRSKSADRTEIDQAINEARIAGEKAMKEINEEFNNKLDALMEEASAAKTPQETTNDAQ